MNIQGKVFVVTGAGGGIGSELVYALIKKGAAVAAVDLRQESLDTLKPTGKNSLSTHVLDISDQDYVARLPDQIIKAHGKVDALINCAGIIQPFVRVNDLDFDAVEKVMNVNFYGTLRMTKAFLPHLLNRPEAYIINFSSMGGFLPVPGQSVYGASKAAVKLLTEALYAELLNTNVRVSVVFPGATATNITKNSGVDTPKLTGSSTKEPSFRMLPAVDAAHIVVKGIENNKPQIFTGKDSKLMNRLYRLNPVFATKLIAKQMKSLLK